MPKTPKIETVKDLEQHINHYMALRGIDFNYEKFSQSVDAGVSVLRLVKDSQTNYRTMTKWVRIYKGNI